MSTAVGRGNRTVSRHFPVSTAVPAQARRLVEAVTELREYPDLHFAAQVLTSELVGNAVRHPRIEASEIVSVRVECDEEMLHLDVTDSGSGFDALSRLSGHRRENEHYHGIFLLNALADRWGYRRDKLGCCVWFELDFVPGRRPWRGRQPVPGWGRTSAP